MPDDQPRTGRALDAEVARKVFGHEVKLVTDEERAGPDGHDLQDVERRYSWRSTLPSGEVVGGWGSLLAYSTDMNAAWAIVEHFRARDYWVRVQEMPDNRPFWRAADDPRSKLHKRALCLIEGFTLPLIDRADGRGYGATAAEAICHAALDAIRVRAWLDGADHAEKVRTFLGVDTPAGPAHDGAEGAGA